MANKRSGEMEEAMRLRRTVERRWWWTCSTVMCFGERESRTGSMCRAGAMEDIDIVAGILWLDVPEDCIWMASGLHLRVMSVGAVGSRGLAN